MVDTTIKIKRRAQRVRKLATNVETQAEARRRNKGRCGGGAAPQATIGRISGIGRQNDPAFAIGAIIHAALDPVKAPSRGRTLADMTPEERAEMMRLYNKPPK